MTEIIFVFGLIIFALFFGLFTIVLLLATNWIINTVGATALLACVSVGILVFYLALVNFRRSWSRAVVDLLEFSFVFVGWVISKFATAIRRLGRIIFFMSVVKSLLSQYPGGEFIQDRRDEIVERGIERIENSNKEITDSPETIIQETRNAYDVASRQLSNGEAVLGISLAGVTLLPPDFALVPYSELLSSALTGAILSVALVLVVAIRTSALDIVMIRNPTADQNKKRLALYRDWNQAVAGGTDVVKVFVIMRVMYGISDSSYDFFVDWIIERQYSGEGVGFIELIRELSVPMFIFVLAERSNLTPSEASQQQFGWDVFSWFEFGPSKSKSPPENKNPYIFDSFFNLFVNFKQEVRDAQRKIARQRAKNSDSSPEEVSKDLYGEDVFLNEEEQDEK